LQEFCQRTHTWFRNGAEEELVETIEQAYLNMLARYEIAYQPVAANAPVLKVRVQTPTGWGETLIAAPSEPEAKT
jgi:2-polyprenyl-3-methyl-5-hydroxy-6-metoxy-1,4-benzoquinol methylase